tara:strand:+ start:1301 stop:2584 length:1284 start_codon:yes stop_codon:yes gene_type:complete
MQFNQLGISKSLLRAIKQSGYTVPTSIQAQSIPAVLSGRDVMAAAQTGTGKTAGFTLPLLQLLNTNKKPSPSMPRALILTPTRELAAQVEESIRTYGINEPLSSTVVFGGVNIRPQIKSLKSGIDILVATPGRLLDLQREKAVYFSDIKILVLDEADRMLDMGFIHDVTRIIKMLPAKRQNLMFSATFSKEVRTLAKTICIKPLEIDANPRNSTVDTIEQSYYSVPQGDKTDLLIRLLKKSNEQVLVFSRTKHRADRISKALNKEKINAVAIHGNKSQNQRTSSLEGFKKYKHQVMVATDIAARGIDIDQLPIVINFDMPHVPEDYVHRIGRTGRAGSNGRAFSFVSDDEKKQLANIEHLIKQKIKLADNVEDQLFDENNETKSIPQKTLIEKTEPLKELQKRRRKFRNKKKPRLGIAKNPIETNHA